MLYAYPSCIWNSHVMFISVCVCVGTKTQHWLEVFTYGWEHSLRITATLILITFCGLDGI